MQSEIVDARNSYRQGMMGTADDVLLQDADVEQVSEMACTLLDAPKTRNKRNKRVTSGTSKEQVIIVLISSQGF